MDTDADPKVIATITTNAAGKVSYVWGYLGSFYLPGVLDFSAAGTKTASVPIHLKTPGTVEFYVYQPDRQLAGSIKLPAIPDSSDLAVTDIFPKKLPRGMVYVRITNRGPDSGSGQIMGLRCKALLTPLPGVFAGADPISAYVQLKNTQSKGETKEFDTSIDVDSDSYSYVVTCSIFHDDSDPNPANNQYSEAIP